MARIIGAHVSTSGGWDKAVKKVAGMGGNAIQIFTSSPRMWKVTDPDTIDFEGFLAARKELGVEKAVIHATYLINLASDNPELVRKSVDALRVDMEICARGKFDGVVVHVGSHQGRGFESVKKSMVEAVGEIVEKSPKGSKFLIENSAGQKGKIASDLAEVRYLLDEVKSNQLGWCFDTCHGHAAGYSLLSTKHEARNSKQISNSKPQTQKVEGGLFEESKQVKTVVEEIEKYDLWESLVCVHVNDSRDDFGSGRDRHENLGEGQIESDDLREFLGDSRLEQIPLILEVPGIDGVGPDAENIRRLKALVS